MKDINKILEKVDYEKRVNEAYTTKIDTEYALVSNKRRLSKLQNIIKLDKSVKLSGFILYFISLIGLMATTSLSIAGGIDRYSGIARTAFIISICFVQLVIFTVSAKESVIKKRFNFHYFKFKLLQAGLLFVSVYFSYEFYIKHIDNPNSIFGIVVTVLLCCLVDFSTIALVSLAFDKRMLNYSEQDSMETRNIFYMIFYNAMFGIRLRALNQYKENVRTIRDAIKENEDLETENMSDGNMLEEKSKILEKEFKTDESLEQDSNYSSNYTEFSNYKNDVIRDDETVIRNKTEDVIRNPNYTSSNYINNENVIRKNSNYINEILITEDKIKDVIREDNTITETINSNGNGGNQRYTAKEKEDPNYNNNNVAGKNETVITEKENSNYTEDSNYKRDNVIGLKPKIVITEKEKSVIAFIKSNYKNGDVIALKDLQKKFTLSVREWSKIRDAKKNMFEVVGKRTYYRVPHEGIK